MPDLPDRIDAAEKEFRALERDLLKLMKARGIDTIEYERERRRRRGRGAGRVTS